MLTYESFAPGETATYGAALMTREAIVEFARAYDPQPFHLDEAAAKNSLLGGLAASGWHTACTLMRLSCDGFLNQSASWGGPGIKQLKWLRPVRPGDLLTARRTLLGKRVSQSRPEMGLLDWHFDLLNQHGEVVMTQDNVIMMGLAGKSAPRAATRAPATLPAPASQPQPKLSGWYEDMAPGETVHLGHRIFEREAIVDFAGRYDPQPFHLSEAAAEKSHFGALAASGWQAAAVWMRLYIDARQAHDAGRAHVAQAGPSPGFHNLVWPKPVFAGDRLGFATQVVEKRPVSRPGWGLVTSLNTAENQAGERVMAFNSVVLMQMRG